MPVEAKETEEAEDVPVEAKETEEDTGVKKEIIKEAK